MNVGEIVGAVRIGQSTVSAHLKALAEVGFVLAEHRGTASYYRINDACVDCFPTAADIVMGRPSPPSQPCPPDTSIRSTPMTETAPRAPAARGTRSSTVIPAWPARPWRAAHPPTAIRCVR